MNIFHDEDLQQHELFSDFSKHCRGLRSATGDPLLIDMAMESFPPELRGPALLHAHWLAANFNSKKLLAYTEGRGIHQQFPALQHNVEIANVILKTLFSQRTNLDPAFLDTLKKTVSIHGVDYALDIIDRAFLTDNDSVAERMELAKSIIPGEVFRSLEVGNHIACRLAYCCENGELANHNKQVLAILETVRDCRFDDIGSINVILAEETTARVDKIFPQLAASYLPALRHGMTYEKLSILPAALKVMPKALLSEVMTFDDAEFKRLVRGQFLDVYLTSGWMEPVGSLNGRYMEKEFSDIMRAFNDRLMSDEGLRSKVERHPAVVEGHFDGLEILYLLPDLLKSGTPIWIDANDNLFAKLVDFAKPYEHMQDLYQAGISLIRMNYERKAAKLYDEVFQNPDLKVKLKNPASVTDTYKFGQMAVMLACERRVRDRMAPVEKQIKLAPIDYMISSGRRRDSGWVASDVLATYAGSMPEDEVLAAAGRRKNYIKCLVDLKVLGTDHYAKLPLKDRGAAFIKELGV